ncbi:ankyrin repeat and KH domain-containing protein mask [Aphelenchoides avenae]|nr:ankyrin repeat and KH domain-containing protein mask [Aphelenchus avenae]
MSRDRLENSVNGLALPAEAAQDQRVFPGGTGKFARRPVATIDCLQPFLHLLPDVSDVDAKEQKRLYQTIYSAGVSAALTLHKYLYESADGGKGASPATVADRLSRVELNALDLKETFRRLGKCIALDEAADALRKLNLSDGELKGDAMTGIVSNEVAAAALSAFASIAVRRPATRQIESVMAASQEAAPHSTEDDFSSMQFESSGELNSHAMPTPTPIGDVAAAPTCKRAGRSRGTTRERSLSSIDGVYVDEDLDDDTDDTQCDCEDETDTDDDCSITEESDSEDMDDVDALFRYACAIGNTELVKQMIEMRKEEDDMLDYKFPCESTPLMEACCGGYPQVVKTLIDAGADVNAVSSSHNTALIYASAAGHLECVQELLKSGRCDLDLRNENGHCALMEAATAGHLEIVKALIDAGATPLSVMDNLDFKESALTLAAYRGHVEVVSFLLKVMPKSEDRAEELHTALMEAAMDGHIDVAKVLLDAGAPVNLPSDSFESPLTLAACGGHNALVELLLDHGADLEEPNDEGYTPLMEASREGHHYVVELLLDRGANVNAKIDDGIETPLTLAASGGFKNIVELLVERGGDLTVGERTPLYEATQEGHVDVVHFIVQKLRETVEPPTVLKDLNSSLVCAAEGNNVIICNILLENGAQVDSVSKDGRTALMEASKEGHMDVIQFLVERGADVNKVSTGHDATALSLASLNGRVEAVKYLLERGANPHQVLKDSVTCLLEASRNGHTDCVEILLDYQAPPNSSKNPTKEDDAKAMPPPTKKPTADSAKRPPQTAYKTSRAELANFSQAKATSSIAKGVRPKAKSMSKVEGSVNSTASSAHVCNHHAPPVTKAPPPTQPPNRDTSKLDKLFTPVSKLTTTTSGTSSALSSLAAAMSNVDSGMPPNASQLLTAMAAAAATASCNGPDDWLFAQFIQRSLLTSKRRDAMSDEDLRNFTEMIQQQFRAIFPSGQVDAAALVTSAGQQALNNIYAAAALSDSERAEIQHTKPTTTTVINASASAETPSSGGLSADESPSPPTQPCCKHAAVKGKHRSTSRTSTCGDSTTQATAATTSSVTSVQPSAIRRKGSTTQSKEEKPVANSADSIIKGGAKVPPGLKQPALLKQKLAETSELIRSKLEALSVEAEYLHHLSTSAPGNGEATIESTTGLQKPEAEKPPRGRRVHNGHSHKCPQGHIHSSNQDRVPPPKRPNAEASYVDMQTDTNHDTALTLACVGGHASPVELLIKRGADVEHKDKKGFTPLILAATGGHVEVCKILLEAKCSVDAQSERTKDTALSLACSGGRKEVVELLLKYGANKEHRNVSDYTPLSLAASGGYVEIIHILLNAGAEINSRTGSKLGISPLMLAAMNGHEAATKLLLERGSDINAQIETNRNTALTLACFQGRTEVVKLLIDYNANVEHRAKTGLTPLMEAANGGYVDVGAALLAADADPNAAPVPTSRDTALTIAADKGHAAFVELLIHAGAAIDVRNKKGCSALWLACNGGHLETVQTLVKHNADVDTQDNRLVSPLMIAFRKGHLKIVKYMVRHVTQFPNDQECTRFMSTITDKDLFTKCKQCLEVIMVAKAKQAEEASKNADALLELLAKEEELAAQKKQSKKRQKEKKKAKKAAVKQLNTNEDDPDEDTPKEEEVQPPEEPKMKPEQEQVEKKKGKKNHPEQIKEEPELSDAEETPVLSAPKAVREQEPADIRVPTMEVTTVVSEPPVEEKTAHGTAAKPSRRGRRSRNESGKSTASTRPAQSSTKENTSATTATGMPSQLSKATAAEEAEWLRASKKRTASKNKPSKAERKAASAAAKAEPTVVTEAAWSSVELSSKKRVQVLSVSSNSIARVIGRAGANINAIREATNAHIEVEKMAARREQATRQITVKGTPEIVKSAVQMIEQLIKDTDSHVNEIIRRVLRGSTSTTSHPTSGTASPSASAMGANISGPAEIPIKPQVATAVTPSGTASSPSPAPTTNVWQQRAAIRQMQKAHKGDVENEMAVNFVTPSFDIVGSESGSKKQVTEEASDSLLSNEEHQKKAPGYARPGGVAGATQHSPKAASSEDTTRGGESGQAPENVVTRIINMPLVAEPEPNGSLVPSLTADITSPIGPVSEPLQLASAVSVPSIDSLTQVSASTQELSEAASDEQIPELRSVKNSQQQPKATRPLSAIWESTGGIDSSPLSPSQIPMNVSGLFGNGGIVDATAAMWLPTTPAKSSSAESATANSLFGAFLPSPFSLAKSKSGAGDSNHADWGTFAAQSSASWNAAPTGTTTWSGAPTSSDSSDMQSRLVRRSDGPPPISAQPWKDANGPNGNYDSLPYFNQSSRPSEADMDRLKTLQLMQLLDDKDSSLGGQDPYAMSANNAMKSGGRVPLQGHGVSAVHSQYNGYHDTMQAPAHNSSEHQMGSAGSNVIRSYLDSMQSTADFSSVLNAFQSGPNNADDQLRSRLYNQMNMASQQRRVLSASAPYGVAGPMSRQMSSTPQPTSTQTSSSAYYAPTNASAFSRPGVPSQQSLHHSTMSQYVQPPPGFNAPSRTSASANQMFDTFNASNLPQTPYFNTQVPPPPSAAPGASAHHAMSAQGATMGYHSSSTNWGSPMPNAAMQQPKMTQQPSTQQQWNSSWGY